MPLKKISAAQTALPPNVQPNATQGKQAAVADGVAVSTDGKNADEPASEPFNLPLAQHSWARFKPGAWRETQTVTSTVDEDGNVIDSNKTIERETLEAVADGKYVLKVQATVELGGKQIVGEAKTRTLHLTTDGSGPLSESRQLEDQAFVLPGQKIPCEVWKLHHQEGSRTLRDLVFLSNERYPHVMLRETVIDPGEVIEKSTEDVAVEAAAVSSDLNSPEVEQRIEVIALSMPCDFEGKVLNCTSIRTVRYREKGDTVQLALVNRDVPGGEVTASSTDYDAEDEPVRFSVSTLLGYEGELIEPTEAPAEPPTP